MTTAHNTPKAIVPIRLLDERNKCSGRPPESKVRRATVWPVCLRCGHWSVDATESFYDPYISHAHGDTVADCRNMLLGCGVHNQDGALPLRDATSLQFGGVRITSDAGVPV